MYNSIENLHDENSNYNYKPGSSSLRLKSFVIGSIHMVIPVLSLMVFGVYIHSATEKRIYSRAELITRAVQYFLCVVSCVIMAAVLKLGLVEKSSTKLKIWITYEMILFFYFLIKFVFAVDEKSATSIIFVAAAIFIFYSSSIVKNYLKEIEAEKFYFEPSLI